MRLTDFIHGSSRPAWTARLLAYVAFIVTITFLVQVVHTVWL